MKRKTHCVNGHRLNKKNVYVDPRNKRQCRECRRLALKRRYYKVEPDGIDRNGLARYSRRKTEEDRFKDSYKIIDGCWVWQRFINDEGYGKFRVKNKMHSAHRYSYEKHVGLIESGLQIDHLCRNRACVNPNHLEAVTPLENNRRSIHGENSRKAAGDFQRAKTHCPKGHPLSGENLRTEKRSDGGMARRCRICDNEKAKRYRNKK